MVTPVIVSTGPVRRTARIVVNLARPLEFIYCQLSHSKYLLRNQPEMAPHLPAQSRHAPMDVHVDMPNGKRHTDSTTNGLPTDSDHKKPRVPESNGVAAATGIVYSARGAASLAAAHECIQATLRHCLCHPSSVPCGVDSLIGPVLEKWHV